MSGILRTGLYVPGDRPDRFAAAEASGADLVVFDLEDAVAPQRKAEARDAVSAWLRGPADDGPARQVRVNAGDDDDLRVVAALPADIGIRLPKTEELAGLDRVAALAPGRSVTALLESARGVLNAARIAGHPAVAALALGDSDLRSELGGGEPVLDHARLVALYAARAEGLPVPMASVFPAIRDPEGLAADTRRLAALGLWGRMAVHPAQLPVIAEVFAPTADEVSWAEEVLSALESGGGVAVLASGEMVDPAMRGRAQRILAARSHG